MDRAKESEGRNKPDLDNITNQRLTLGFIPSETGLC